jgi:hypothetical protein
MANSLNKKIKYSLKTKDKVIYCGPNIPGGMLSKYRIFKDGIPEYLNELIDKCPEIKMLFVPVAELTRANRAIDIKGTPEQIAYEKVMKFISKGGV